jgi:excisionase family DNA binding protein
MPNGPSGADHSPAPEHPGAVLLTVAQVCERLQISRPTFYGLLESGQLRSLTIGRARRVVLADLEALIAAKREEARRGAAPEDAP